MNRPRALPRPEQRLIPAQCSTHQRIEHLEDAPAFLLFELERLRRTHASSATLVAVARGLLELCDGGLELVEKVTGQTALEERFLVDRGRLRHTLGARQERRPRHAFVIIAVATDERTPMAVAPFAIGATVFAGALVTGPLTGGSFNPARSLGPALVGGIWTNHWLYWCAPIVGMVIAMHLYEKLRGGEQPTTKQRIPLGVEGPIEAR